METNKIRTFLAIHFGGSYEAEFGRLLEALSAYSKQVKWVNPAQVHLTLHFFGSIEPERVETLKILFRNLAARYRPLEVFLKGFGAFPGLNRPRVLWVGLDGDVKELKDIKEACDLELVRIGFPIEEREFKPHLTLGRVREGSKINIVLPGYLQNYVHDEKHRIQELILYKSELTPKGSIYTPLERFPLQG